jgi:hypothetical protein
VKQANHHAKESQAGQQGEEARCSLLVDLESPPANKHSKNSLAHMLIMAVLSICT